MNSTAIGLGVWHSGLTLSLALIFVGATSAAAQPVAPPEAAAQTVTPVPQTPEARAAEERAQAHPAEPEWFLEPTYAAPMFGSKSAGAQGKPVVEIQSFHHVPMFPRQNSDRYQKWIGVPNNEQRARNRFALTLGTIIRGHDGPSVPIQTPSVIFAGRGQRMYHRRRGDVSTIRVYEVGVYHHSNGQDGCTFTDQQRIDDECRPALEPAPDNWTVNTKDGSFGVNYLSGKVGWSRRTLDPAITTGGSQEVRTAHNLHVEYRRYVTSIPGGSGIKQIAKRFGRNELEVQWQWEVPSWPAISRLRHYQFTARGWRRFGSDANGAGAISGEVAWLGFAGGLAGPFLRLYRGSDYYNIRFEEERRHVMVGLKWDRPRMARIPAAVK